MKKIIFLSSVFLLSFCISGCGGGGGSSIKIDDNYPGDYFDSTKSIVVLKSHEVEIKKLYGDWYQKIVNYNGISEETQVEVFYKYQDFFIKLTVKKDGTIFYEQVERY